MFVFMLWNTCYSLWWCGCAAQFSINNGDFSFLTFATTQLVLQAQYFQISNACFPAVLFWCRISEADKHKFHWNVKTCSLHLPLLLSFNDKHIQICSKVNSVFGFLCTAMSSKKKKKEKRKTVQLKFYRTGISLLVPSGFSYFVILDQQRLSL